MERPYEFLRRITSFVPEKDRDKIQTIATHLEELGRVHRVKVEDKQGILNKVLEENGVITSEGDEILVSEAWDRKAKV